MAKKKSCTNKIKQANPKVTGKSLVDDFHRRHAATNDPLLARHVVIANISAICRHFGSRLALACNTLQQGINFFLG